MDTIEYNGRQRFKSLLNTRRADRNGFWIGSPLAHNMDIYLKEAKVSSPQELSQKMGDDFRWLPADHLCWKHPENSPMFDPLGGAKRLTLSQSGIFADCEDPRVLERYTGWPDPQYIDLDAYEQMVDDTHALGMAVAGGMWSCFFHVVAAFFGMENYFIMMHTNQDIVDIVTEKVADFYLEANRRIFERMADKLDVFFFGNDFGTQSNLIISPAFFQRFILPTIRKLVALAHRYGLPVMTHSCGAISAIIPDLIDAGINALHPLQALAAGMDAKSLSLYRDKLLFVGGIDTQQLLPYATPDQVKREVYRIREHLGEGWIVSPSHESPPSFIPYENLVAMRDAAMGR